MTKYVLRAFIIMIWLSERDIFYLSHRCKYQSELPRPIPWNQTSDVHRGSNLITWHWRHRNHANTITSVIAEKQTVINEVYVFFNKISL